MVQGKSLVALKDQFVGWVGNTFRGMTFIVDLVNACPLRCPTCAVGVMPARRGMMSIDLFRRILVKATHETKIRRIQLYAYSDPCLHPKLDLFVRECTERGIETSISTMLQTTNCDFSKVIEARPTEFRISFPGWEKMHIYQRNAKPEVFNRKLEEVCALPRYPETKWTMAFHLYRDNFDEVPKARELARRLGLHLVVLPAIFMVNERVVEKTYTEADREIISRLLETPEEGIARMKGTDYCQMQSKQITIDATGEVYLCQIVYEDRFRIVPYLEYALSDIRRVIRNDKFCVKCKQAKGHVYQYCYADFVQHDNPIDIADKRRFGKLNVLRLPAETD